MAPNDAAKKAIQLVRAVSAQPAFAPNDVQVAKPLVVGSQEFKHAIAAKYKELVDSGVSKAEAAKRSVQLVRDTAVEPPLAKLTDSRAEESVPCPGGPFTCFICVEAKGAHERFLPHRCSAIPDELCCKPCFVAWAESQIDADASIIKCCHCDAHLEPSTLARLVDAEHWAKYSDAALQRHLRRDSAFIWCSKCSYGGWIDPKQPTSTCGWVCPECSNSFVYCPFCRREHGSLTCKRFQKIRQEMGGAKDRESQNVVQRNSKMCPSCQMPIQKEGGCNFMDCPNCRRHFCWSCGRILKGSHQSHDCDAGFEGSAVVHQTPTGRVSVEFTRLFTNILDIENIELLNTDEADLEDLRELLVPGLNQEARSPFFVGPSQCDGEILIRVPFNFKKSMSWELTHILVQATHPPAPHSFPPRSVALLANAPSATFTDLDDAALVPVQETSRGVFLIPLEQFRLKGTFKRVTCLTLRFSVAPVPSEGNAEDFVLDDDAQVFFNDLALFGVPSDRPTSSNKMWDDRANLIVSPVLKKRRWGEEVAEEDEASEDHRAAAQPPPATAQAPAAPTIANVPAVPFPDVKAARRRNPSKGHDRTYVCATPDCPYLIHSRPELGGYCCIACAEGGPHGPRCERRAAPPGTRRADPEWAYMDGEDLAEKEYEDAMWNSMEDADSG